MAKYYLTGEMKKIGLEIYEDGFGTLFGRREGTMKDAPVVMLGSHYDSDECRGGGYVRTEYRRIQLQSNARNHDSA